MLALSLLLVSLSLGHGLTAQREGRVCNAVSDCGELWCFPFATFASPVMLLQVRTATERPTPQRSYKHAWIRARRSFFRVPVQGIRLRLLPWPLVRSFAGVYLSGALTLRRHQTLSVGGNATLLGSTDWKAYDMRYTRTAGLMREAHAGLLNGAQCLKMKVDSADADQCDQWGSLKNITIEGPGVIDGQGAGWWEKCRPTCPDGT